MVIHCFPKTLSCPYPSGESLVLTKRIAASKEEIREERNVIKLFRVKTPSISVLRYSLYMYIKGTCHLHKPVEILVDKNLTTGSYFWRTELARVREEKGWNDITTS